MKIGLLDIDSKIPNLALMKIARYHKNQGDDVEWMCNMEHYDRVYASKIFNFSQDYEYAIQADEVMRGGTGYDLTSQLPQEIDQLQPLYDIYPNHDKRTAMGFLTRGCPNKCKWCVVPIKEGTVRPYMDIEEIAIDGRNKITLMDNNVLACDYGLEQIEKIIKLGLKIDFNQAMDARLVTDDIAKMLAQVKWIRYIRFGCDTPHQVDECERAIALIDKYGYKGEYFFYTMLHGEFNECFDRINHWKQRGRRFLPYAQPFRDTSNQNTLIPQWQKDMAGWVNLRWVYQSCDFKDFQPRKNFKCEEYFKQY